MKVPPKHRGRIQAQGGGIEESENWAKDTPPSMAEGLEMLDNLKKKLSKKEQENRKELFDKAERFIKAAGKTGGVTAKVTKKIQKKDSEDERIDIEVIAGIAFISFLFILVVYKLL
jgi:hypothetical protein